MQFKMQISKNKQKKENKRKKTPNPTTNNTHLTNIVYRISEIHPFTASICCHKQFQEPVIEATWNSMAKPL